MAHQRAAVMRRVLRRRGPTRRRGGAAKSPRGPSDGPPSSRRKLDRPEVGGVFVEREARGRPVVVAGVAGQDAAEVSLDEDEDVIQTVAPGRADELLGARVLPGAVWRRKDFVIGKPERNACNQATYSCETIGPSRRGGRDTLRRVAAEHGGRYRAPLRNLPNTHSMLRDPSVETVIYRFALSTNAIGDRQRQPFRGDDR